MYTDPYNVTVLVHMYFNKYCVVEWSDNSIIFFPKSENLQNIKTLITVYENTESSAT